MIQHCSDSTMTAVMQHCFNTVFYDVTKTDDINSYEMMDEMWCAER